ncbi:MAG: hypothetical protein ACRDQZ_09180 [Mycobacteriales bacterium]
MLQNRATKEVWATYRFAYKDGHENWYKIHPKGGDSPEQAETRLRCGIEDVFRQAAKIMDKEITVECFYPPNRGENAAETIQFFVDRDLMTVVGVEPRE